MLSSSSLLPPSVWATFEKGGYYSHSPVPGLLIVGINSVYWYKKWLSFSTQASMMEARPFLDTLDSDSKLGYYVVEDLEARGINTSTLASDPAGQFAWLEGVLKAAQAANQMCILTWHVGLGTSATGGDILWNDNFFSSFVDIVCPPLPLTLLLRSPSPSGRALTPVTAAEELPRQRHRDAVGSHAPRLLQSAVR